MCAVLCVPTMIIVWNQITVIYRGLARRKPARCYPLAPHGAHRGLARLPGHCVHRGAKAASSFCCALCSRAAAAAEPGAALATRWSRRRRESCSASAGMAPRSSGARRKPRPLTYCCCGSHPSLDARCRRSRECDGDGEPAPPQSEPWPVSELEGLFGRGRVACASVARGGLSLGAWHGCVAVCAEATPR